MRRTISVALAAIITALLLNWVLGVDNVDGDTGRPVRSADAREIVTFLIYPSAHPEEDLYGCDNGWVEDAYTAQANGGATVTCVRLHHGETRAGYYARRNAG